MRAVAPLCAMCFPENPEPVDALAEACALSFYWRVCVRAGAALWDTIRSQPAHHQRCLNTDPTGTPSHLPQSEHPSATSRSGTNAVTRCDTHTRVLLSSYASVLLSCSNSPSWPSRSRGLVLCCNTHARAVAAGSIDGFLCQEGTTEAGTSQLTTAVAAAFAQAVSFVNIDCDSPASGTACSWANGAITATAEAFARTLATAWAGGVSECGCEIEQVDIVQDEIFNVVATATLGVLRDICVGAHLGFHLLLCFLRQPRPMPRGARPVPCGLGSLD